MELKNVNLNGGDVVVSNPNNTNLNIKIIDYFLQFSQL
jgi:hypothetical protein